MCKKKLWYFIHRLLRFVSTEFHSKLDYKVCSPATRMVQKMHFLSLVNSRLPVVLNVWGTKVTNYSKYINFLIIYFISNVEVTGSRYGYRSTQRTNTLTVNRQYDWKLVSALYQQWALIDTPQPIRIEYSPEPCFTYCLLLSHKIHTR